MTRDDFLEELDKHLEAQYEAAKTSYEFLRRRPLDLDADELTAILYVRLKKLEKRIEALAEE